MSILVDLRELYRSFDLVEMHPDRPRQGLVELDLIDPKTREWVVARVGKIFLMDRGLGDLQPSDEKPIPVRIRGREGNENEQLWEPGGIQDIRRV